MKYDTAKIAEAIKKAVSSAQQFSEIDDGGTCNFDCAYLFVPGMRKSQAKEIENIAGVSLSLNTSRWQGRILQIIGGRLGQGARQTKMAETMRDSIKQDGFEAGMYYQMD